ncbi:hypothetical protein [Massilia timonae]|uniref:hypothetical protein n=1 Tax=Massilia timonae TaxID=47229 RepID=UPI0028A0FB2B|nr:hypothetical protein [Massilia timonae]
MGRATNSAAQAQPNSALQASAKNVQRYVGDVMLNCVVSPSAFTHCCAVIVSGDPGNPCGHSLLHTGGGWYFHVAGENTVPRCLVSCDHIPRRSWPLFRAKAMLSELIAGFSKPGTKPHQEQFAA